MHTLSASELLDVWERGRGQPPVRQALLLLEAAYPNEPADTLAALPVGHRDARLLHLRARTLGPLLDSEVTCPACGDRLEFTLPAGDLLPPTEVPPSEPLSLRSNGYTLTFRLPNSRDLIEASHEPSGTTTLLACCLIDAQHHDEAVPADVLPDAVVALMTERMAAADPLADLRIALTCPACGHAWEAVFDVVSFFWNEVETWAGRLLRDVHQLARAYGWREADILAMSAWRRRQYLDLLHE